VSEHSRASHRGRAVLVQLALRARHDGMPTSDVSRAQLEHRTGMSLTNVRYGLAEVRRLGEVRVVEQGGGRGRPTRYYVPAPPCPAEAECWDCRVLADTIAKTGRDVPGFESVNDKGNRARERGNRARDGRNRAHPAHTHGTGTDHPSQGGTVPYPESERPRSRRPSADAAAAPALAAADQPDPRPGIEPTLVLEVLGHDPGAVYEPGADTIQLTDGTWLPNPSRVREWLARAERAPGQERGAAS
jgi:hypothetical protein